MVLWPTLLPCTHALKALLFWAVDSDPQTMSMVKKNIAYARQAGGRNCCDVFLAHYAGKHEDWGEEWTSSEVANYIEEGGFKFHLMQKAYNEAPRRWEDIYEFVWALDSDIDFTQSQLFTLFEDARRSKASIIGPTFIQRRDYLSYSFLSTGIVRQSHVRAEVSVESDAAFQMEHEREQIHVLGKPDPSCAYRHTNFVEMTAPLMKRNILSLILKECEGCLGKHAEWGLDRIWCGLADEKLGTPGQSCALLDSASVHHLDWRKATVTKEFHETELAVKARYTRFWSSPKNFDCVSVDSNTEDSELVQTNETNATQ